MVMTHAVQATDVLRRTLLTHASPKVKTILWRGCECCHRQFIRHKCELAAAVQALHAVKKNEVTTMVAIEYTHGVELIPSHNYSMKGGQSRPRKLLRFRTCVSPSQST